jgi:hypothetical protein
MSPQKDVNDAPLERELEQLLSVEPSAEFQARVRTRVARETIAAPGDALWGWFGLRLLAFAAACVVLAMVVVRWNRQATPSPQARVTPAVREIQPSSTRNAVPTTVPSTVQPLPEATTRLSTVRLPPSRDALRRPGEADPPVPVAAAQTSASHDPFNDVLVSANELKALRQIEMLLAGKQLKEEEAPVVTAVRNDMTELAIAPIAIEPIQIAAIKGDAE